MSGSPTVPSLVVLRSGARAVACDNAALAAGATVYVIGSPSRSWCRSGRPDALPALAEPAAAAVGFGAGVVPVEEARLADGQDSAAFACAASSVRVRLSVSVHARGSWVRTQNEPITCSS